MSRAVRLTLAIAILAMGLGGCGHVQSLARLGRPTPWVETTPVATSGAAEDATARRDRLYRLALAAIDKRDYGLAIDLLQTARSDGEADPRILNGLGVVYDKLQRFDLSARYYDLAEKADPGSRVVEENRRYSKLLQTHAADMQAGGPVRLARADPAPAAAASPTSATAIAGPIRFLNATGARGGATRIRARLSRQGWSVPRTSVVQAPAQAKSAVRAPPGSERLAMRLSRTLPFPVEIEACADCSGVDFVVGTDALRRWGRGST